MSDTTITVVSIFLAAILMFVFPLITLADRNDDVAQVSVQQEVTEAVNEIATTGKLTLDGWSNLESALAATGNSYDVEIEFQILDENPGKKTSQTNNTKIGENVYYSVYTTQITNVLTENGEYALKEGDIVKIEVKNTSTTLSQNLKNFWYKVTGNDLYIISGSWSAVVSVNGN
jgi:hypothetical protein